MRIIQVRGTAIASKLIEWQTWGEWSHSALLFSDNVVIESRELHWSNVRCCLTSGVHCMTLTAWLKDNPDVQYRIFEVKTTWEQEAAIRLFASAQDGKPYDYWGIARFIARDYTDDYGDKWFCSELVFESFLVAAIVLLARIRGPKVPPSMITTSPLVLDL